MEVRDYEYVISFRALYLANKRAKKSKEYRKEEVINFQTELGSNLWALHYELKYGTYKTGGYRKFFVYEPKKREIEAIPYRDRVVQHSLCDNYLIPLVSQYLISENVACREGKGGKEATRLMRKYLHECAKSLHGDWYFVYLDISKFFDSIDHDLLKEKLSKIGIDQKVDALIFRIIDSYEKEKGKGLPMGNQSSQMMALLYLNDFDHYVKKTLGERMYVRYMDDMVILVKGRERAKEVYSSCHAFLNKERLIINSKSGIRKISQGIGFVGFRFFIGKNERIVKYPRNATKRRIAHNIRKRRKVSPRSSLMSYLGLLKGSRAHLFKKRVVELLLASGSS